jgi:hypothetical protein
MLEDIHANICHGTQLEANAVERILYRGGDLRAGRGGGSEIAGW